MKFHIHRNIVIIMMLDIVILSVVFLTAHFIRFDFNVPEHFLTLFYKTLPLVLLIKIPIFYYCNLYHGMWRYTSVRDLVNVVKGALAGSLLIVVCIVFYNRFEGFSRSVFANDLFLTIFFIGGIRLMVRVFYENQNSGFIHNLWGTLFNKKEFKRLIIIGAGNTGEKIYRVIRDNPVIDYHVVGFLDDHPVKTGKRIHGVPVLGKVCDVKYIAEKVQANELLIAISSTTSSQMRDIVDYCKDSRLPFKTIPSMNELIDGSITVNSIRDVAYSDLLGREKINLDKYKIGSYLKNKIVMITGAGGSIGSELSLQICRYSPQKVILFERAETHLYNIDLELRQFFPNLEIIPVLGDIQDMQELEMVFSNHHPEIVFHAAAYKHVPMLENQSWKAVRNNILGTFNLAECATKHDIERFVLVSTDKAVRPTNVMGASKRIAEILIQNQDSSKLCRTKFMIVRFGNVVGSAGSVLPLFKKQIEQGGPVTVTHPEVERYFMTITESAQLILQAGAMGEGGEIFILDMGNPIRIDAIARDLIRLSGFEPDKDIKIDYIGLRPGEKLYEELITEGEGIVPTEHKKIMVLRGAEQNLQMLNGNIGQLADLAKKQDREKIIEKLQKIVPEYTPVVH